MPADTVRETVTLSIQVLAAALVDRELEGQRVRWDLGIGRGGEDAADLVDELLEKARGRDDG